jgi:predicted transglutaminase-like cysteine proteinase
MGKGEIISEIGDGQYSVKLLYEGRDRLVASIALFDTKITDLETRISDLEDEIADLSLPDDADEIARLTFKLNVAKLQLTAIQKRKYYLEDNFPDDPIQDAWCIDLTTGLAGIVAIAEINGEMDQVNIRPGFTDSAVYDSDRDGQMMPAIGGSPEQVLVNWMIFPGWQKWLPTYRTGIIVTGSIDHDLHTCSVCLDPVFSSQDNLNINQGADWGDCPGVIPSGWSQFCADNPSHPACVNTIENDPLYITPGILDIIRATQALVNSEHPYLSDKSGKEIGDYWKILGEGEAGDCEDIALTKMDELVDAGVPVGNLQIITAYTETGGYHAALMIRTQNMGNIILDNRYNEIMDQNSLSYRWHLFQKTGVEWGQYSSLLEEVTIEYMSCHSWAFEDGDRVIVEFENQDFSQPKVIGFIDNPNHCGADFYEFGLSYIGHYVYSTESWILHTGVGAYRDLATAMKGAKIGLDCYLTGGIERPLVPVWDVDHWIWDQSSVCTIPLITTHMP